VRNMKKRRLIQIFVMTFSLLLAFSCKKRPTNHQFFQQISVNPVGGGGGAVNCNEGDDGINLMNSIFSEGGAQVIEIGGIQVYEDDLEVECDDSWYPQGSLCDEGDYTNSKTQSYKTDEDSGASWEILDVDYNSTGYLIVDLGEAKKFNELRSFQMFSDGKTVKIRFAVHPELGDEAPTNFDSEWEFITKWSDLGEGVDNSDDLPDEDDGSLVGDPLVNTVDYKTTRYLFIEVMNDDTLGNGDGDYIELRAVKMFCEEDVEIDEVTLPDPADECNEEDIDINILNGEETGGDAIMVDMGGLEPYADDFDADCDDSWEAIGLMCDTESTTDSKLFSSQYDSDQGTSWEIEDEYYKQGFVIIDLGESRTFNELRSFQMFSDGKTSHLRFAVHPEEGNEPPSYFSSDWTYVTAWNVVPAGTEEEDDEDGNSVVSGPGIIELANIYTTRYLIIDAANDGRYGDEDYIEVRSVKMFCSEE